MGETIVKIKISSLKNSHWEEVETLVDTGATYSTIPCEILEKLGIEKVDKIHLKFANGKIEERAVGFAFIEVANKLTPERVIFGEKEDAIVLGLITLESCGLAVDPVNRKLVPLQEIHHYMEVTR